MMKDYGKMILTGMLLSCGLSVYAQQIPKKLILVEKWSGTWCLPCTGAARAMEDMDTENKKVALISYQIEKDDVQKEKFETEDGTARAEYYGGIEGYPTTRFDGNAVYSGGHWSASIYPALLPLYEEAMSKKTSFDLGVSSLIRHNLTDFTAKVNVSKLDFYDSDNLKLRFALVEKVIPEPWQNMLELHYVQRDMFPDADGVHVEFDGNGSKEYEIEGFINPEWQEKELEIICFLQDDNTKEVLQTVSYPFSRTEVQKKGSKTCNFNEIDCFWFTVSSFADELKGYRVYSESGELISEVAKDCNTYSFVADKPGETSVYVSAVYEKNGETEKSLPIGGACYRNTMAGSPQYLEFVPSQNGAKDGVLSWKPYVSVEDGCLHYTGFNTIETKPDGSLDVQEKGGALMENVWVAYDLDADEQFAFRGMDLSYISFIPGNVDAGYEIGVFRDGKLVYIESVDRQLLTEGKWYNHKLAKPFFIPGKGNIKIGYRIKDLSGMPIVIDKGPVIIEGKTNLIGLSSGTDVEWSALYSGNNIMRLGFEIPASQGNFKVAENFVGYMVYRDGERMLPVPQKNTEYIVSGNNTDGIYTVTAVFDECESVVSNSVQIGDVSVYDEMRDDAEVLVKVFSRNINIIGDYSSVEFFDLSGHLVYASNKVDNIVMNNAGGYIVRICLPDNKVVVKKIVIK